MSHIFEFASGSTNVTLTVNVFDSPDTVHPNMAVHDILDQTYSVVQYLGGRSPLRRFQFWLYGEAQMTRLGEMAQDGHLFVYVDDRGTSGSYVVTGEVTRQRVQALNYADNWYRCQMSATYLYGSGSTYYEA